MWCLTSESLRKVIFLGDAFAARWRCFPVVSWVVNDHLGFIIFSFLYSTLGKNGCLLSSLLPLPSSPPPQPLRPTVLLGCGCRCSLGSVVRISPSFLLERHFFASPSARALRVKTSVLSGATGSGWVWGEAKEVEKLSSIFLNTRRGDNNFSNGR